MLAEMAHAAHAGAEAAHPVHLQAMATYIVGVGAVGSLATVGIVAYIKLRFSRAEKETTGIGNALDIHKREIYAWRTHFLERYQSDREGMIREYATNASVEKVEERMEAIRTELMQGIRGLQNSFDRLRERLEKRGG